METLQKFARQKDFLVCVDSDGCAIDTMDIKHIRCFGPCLIQEWHLERWEQHVLTRWNELNLYSTTRGANRFKTLAVLLEEVNTYYTPIEGTEELSHWASSSPELSNAALEKAAKSARGPALQKALHWSQAVNSAIDTLPADAKKPFEGVLEGLRAAYAVADVAVVSSANRKAVEEEWARCGLLDYVDVLCCQDDGSKADCIARLKGKGYASGHVLMVGDAPGDSTAAAQNGVYFYPILVRHERESWQEFTATALPALLEGSYAPYGAQAAARFVANLGAKT